MFCNWGGFYFHWANFCFILDRPCKKTRIYYFLSFLKIWLPSQQLQKPCLSFSSFSFPPIFIFSPSSIYLFTYSKTHLQSKTEYPWSNTQISGNFQAKLAWLSKKSSNVRVVPSHMYFTPAPHASELLVFSSDNVQNPYTTHQKFWLKNSCY